MDAPVDSHEGPTVAPATDLVRYRATDEVVWFEEPLSADVDELLVGVPADQRFAAELPGGDPATYAGIYGVRPMSLTVPGADAPRTVPCAGLTWVGVHPDRRRRGVLTEMLRDHFERVHETPGTHLSALHASEPAIYGRHGYGLASSEVTATLARGTTLTAPHLDSLAGAIVTTLTDIRDEGAPARLRASEERAAAGQVGAITGVDGFYTSVCAELPERGRDKEPRRILFATLAGVDVGHALLRRQHRWDNGRPAGEISVHRLVGTPAARLALARRLVDLDLTGSVKVDGLGIDDELLRWLGGPRGASNLDLYDSLWVRLVDLPEALAARGYAAPCDVVVEVTDEAAPWNTGRWRVAVDDAGVADVARCEHDADLLLTTQVLASAYLGGVSLVRALDAGTLLEQRHGAARELWRALRTDSAPVGSINF